MHVSECVLIMAISIFMIIASLLLFARSINLHLLPDDWQLNLTGHHWAAGIQALQHTSPPTEDAESSMKCIKHRGHCLTHLQVDTHIQADSVIGIHPCGCNHRRLSKPSCVGLHFASAVLLWGVRPAGQELLLGCMWEMAPFDQGAPQATIYINICLKCSNYKPLKSELLLTIRASVQLP